MSCSVYAVGCLLRNWLVLWREAEQKAEVRRCSPGQLLRLTDLLLALLPSIILYDFEESTQFSDVRKPQKVVNPGQLRVTFILLSSGF